MRGRAVRRSRADCYRLCIDARSVPKPSRKPHMSTNFLPKLRGGSLFVPTPPSRRRSPTRSSIFEPRRFGRRDRGARGPDSNNGVRAEMASQRLEKIESGVGNGSMSEASKAQHLVHGRAADRALRPTKRRDGLGGTKLQKKGKRGKSAGDHGGLRAARRLMISARAGMCRQPGTLRRAPR